MRIRLGGGRWSKFLSIAGIVVVLVIIFSSLWSWIGGSNIQCPEGFNPNFSIFHWVIQRETDLNGDGWLCQQLVSASPIENTENYEFVDNIQ